MHTLLQINVSLNYGSTGKIAEQIGLLAEHAGWNCYIAHGPRYKNPSQLKSISVGSIYDEVVHAGIYSMLLDKHGLGSVSATKKLIKIIDSKIKPDIVHLHNIHGYYINYEILFDYLVKKEIPVIWTLHDCWSFTGHCAYFDYQGCERWKSQCYSCPLISSYPKSLWLDNSKNNYLLKKKSFTALKNNLILVPVSEWLAGLVQNSFFKGCMIKTIHNGIDLESFCEQSVSSLVDKLNIKNKRVLLGVAAHWSARKGLVDFLQLRKQLSDDYLIILIGLTRKQVQNLPKGIIGIERTQNVMELAQFYSLADILINTSHEDNYPTINLESMACGTPVVTYKTGGSPEAITSETGIVVEKGDIDALVEAIYQINLLDKQALHDACIKRAKLFFDRNKCFQEYIQLYNEVLNRK